MASEVLNSSGSVGSLIGAALETAGYQTQSQILNSFEAGLSSHIGGLFYLIAILGAVITISVGGSYRYGLWLLIGPPLFFFLTQTREPISEARWQMGENHHEESKDRIITGAAEIGDPERRVSVFFNAWNKLTTDIVQELIRLLHITENGSDLTFINKTDLYLGVWNSITIDPTLKGFVNLTLVNKCASYINLQMQISSPSIPSERKDVLRQRLAEHSGNGVQVNMDDQKEWFIDWLKNVLPDHQVKSEYTCNELWGLAIDAFRGEAKRNFEMKLRATLPPGLKAEHRLLDFQTKCEQIVENTGLITQDLKLALKSKADGEREVSALCISTFINEIAARALANEFSSANRNLIGMNLNEHHQLLGRNNFGGLKFQSETSRSIREVSNVESYLHRGELIAGAMTLPYIQGMCLYFLAFTFPFFALMVIIPGRESAILTWMSLWLWLRLWDFGFAVVMLIDNILYALLPHGPAMYDEIAKDPGKAFAALLETDPTYSAFTYYNLVACCLFAVPVVTGMLVTKGGGELVNAVSQGWKEFPQLFGVTMSNFNKAFTAQEKLRDANRRMTNSVRASAWELTTGDSFVTGKFKEAGALKVAAKLVESGRVSLGKSMSNQGLSTGGISKEVLRLTGSAAAITLTEMSRKAQDQASSKQNLNLQLKKHAVGNDDFTRIAAAEAVGYCGFNSHYISPTYPMDAVMNHIRTLEQNNVSGKTADALVNLFFEEMKAK